MESRGNQLRRRGWIALLGGAAGGAGLAALSAGSFWMSWLLFSVFLAGSLWALLAAWQAAGAGRALGWMIALAFLLRLGCGVGLRAALPVYGYDEAPQKAGYVFYDAFQRDSQAWKLAGSGESLMMAFQNEFGSDQYGGMLSLSAAIYRYLSPDAQRTELILILSALLPALGTAFLWRALAARWNAPLATLAGWFYALYPESILLGSSQMREPLLIGLSAIALWAVVSWRSNRRAAAWTLAASLVGVGLLSFRVLLPMVGMLAVWFLLEYSALHLTPRQRKLLWAGVVVGGLLLAVGMADWLRTSAQLDLKLSVLQSGRVDKAIKEIGTQWRLPFLMVYGLLQPVLPAAIADDALPIWRIIGTLRAAGWYALAPLLLYALFTVWKAQMEERKLLIWSMGASVAWILISALRAGGDQWDNPRYRTIFLVWLVLLAAWAVRRALAQRDPWLWRWLAVEAIFLGFFTNWYISRYYQVMKRLLFWDMIAWIVGLSVLVLAGGWVWDRIRQRRA